MREREGNRRICNIKTKRERQKQEKKYFIKCFKILLLIMCARDRVTPVILYLLSESELSAYYIVN